MFVVDDDRKVYLELLKEQADKYGLEILAYCLMTNHIHLVAIPHEEDALAKAVGRTHFRYTQGGRGQTPNQALAEILYVG